MRFLKNSVVQGIGISLLLHFLVFGSIELAYQLGWLNHGLLQMGLFKRDRKDDRVTQLQFAESRTEEVPLLFIDVDPAQEVSEPPKESKFYSSRNSLAADPDPQDDSDAPRIAGTQDKVPRTFDSPKSEPVPLEPAPEPEPEAPQQAQTKPEPPAPPPEPEPQPELPEPDSTGDIALAKPSEKPDRPPAEPDKREPEPEPPRQRPRPRRLAAVRPPSSPISGEKMRQQGGARRFKLEVSENVRATPFGAYDAAIIAAVQQRWYDLLDARSYAVNTAGKVVLTFRLNSDGRITEMKVHENEVSEILAFICQRAVLDPAPFAPWPSDLRRLVGADYREVRFTFHYD